MLSLPTDSFYAEHRFSAAFEVSGETAAGWPLAAVVTHLLENNSHECSHELPQEIASRLVGTPDDLARVTFEVLAAQCYRRRKLIHAQVNDARL